MSSSSDASSSFSRSSYSAGGSTAYSSNSGSYGGYSSSNYGGAADPNKLLGLQSQLDATLAKMNSYTTNPAYTGYDQDDINRALKIAFGDSSSFLSTLGGVGLENLGLKGVSWGNGSGGISGISSGGGINDLLNMSDGFTQIALELGGPNSMTAKLLQKASVAYLQRSQNQYLQVAMQQQQLEQQLLIKQSLGIELSDSEIALYQQFATLLFQAQQEYVKWQNSSVQGAFPGTANPYNSYSQQGGMYGGYYPQNQGFGGVGYPQTAGFGYPQSGGFGYPQAGGFGYPQAGGFGGAYYPQNAGFGGFGGSQFPQQAGLGGLGNLISPNGIPLAYSGGFQNPSGFGMYSQAQAPSSVPGFQTPQVPTQLLFPFMNNQSYY